MGRTGFRNDEYLNTIDLSQKQRNYLETRHHYVEMPMEYELYENIYSEEDTEMFWSKSQSFTDEEIEALREAIELLTPKQNHIIKELLKGKTQTAIAKELGINQSSISLTLHGAHNYGGIIRKLKKLMIKMENV